MGFSKADHVAAQRMLDQGKSVREVAASQGVSTQAIYKALKSGLLSRRPSMPTDDLEARVAALFHEFIDAGIPPFEATERVFATLTTEEIRSIALARVGSVNRASWESNVREMCALSKRVKQRSIA